MHCFVSRNTDSSSELLLRSGSFSRSAGTHNILFIMMKLMSLIAVVGAATASVVTPSPHASEWKVVGRPASSTVEFTIAVKQNGMDEIKRIAGEVSNPASDKWGQFLTQAEINEITKPATSDVDAVTSWINTNGCSFETQHNMFTVECSVANAEKMLSTAFFTLTNNETDQTTVRSVSAYVVPANVESSVAAIFGVHGLPLPPSANIVSHSFKSNAGEPVKVTPDVIATTYMVKGVMASAEKNVQAVAEFQGQYFSQVHLTEFFEKYLPSSPGHDSVVTAIHGKNMNSSVGVEAELDIQYIMGVSPGVSTEFWSQKNSDFCADLVSWTSLLLKDDSTPLVNSVSYGWQGSLAQIQCLKMEVTEIDAAFVKLAAKGIAVIFASGDSGSGFTQTGMKDKLWPSWPASSAWVTSVGATRFQGQDASQPEMASDQFGSGGGFSWDFNRSEATWQEASVKAYFAADTTLPPSTVYNAMGRGTPDVSALGEGFQVLTGSGKHGFPESVGGTSASTPLFAGLVSLLNDARMAKGMKPLGYLNPWIYANADAFTDIVMGTNAIDRGGEKVKYGWECTAGWDAATGLGTPIFPKLLEAAMKA
eukprot:m.20570 g.20570  ORF g.20570 m.20570 type:complete len:593 (+) comp12989_c0_seq1:25-1803(+)